jgi:quinoprotein glucose dehydrogenase
MHRLRPIWIVLIAGFFALLPARGGEKKEYTPPVAKASDDGLRTLRRMRLPDGLHADLFAAEPLLANPVSFCFDEKGRVYVAETFRLHDGVTDNRGHMNWLDDELAIRTVADRVALYKKYLGKQQLERYTAHHDRVRLLEDTKGSGKADKSTVFADGFNRLEDGLGSGVLARHGNVYYTCIPDLWLLRDTKGTGHADVKQSLHTGYGVHVSFIGHDMHGLRFGPDGKLYFSIGDRGLHVRTREGTELDYPDTGAVMRCDPDGSNLEVVAYGLRNPQELAFDQYGNLFTGDNNCDTGDAARIVYVVEGGDSGWRIGYQYLRWPNAAGPWNSEKLWHLPFPGQSASLVPPVAHLANGPSGLTYNPGVTLLPQDYDGCFFLCDFRGSGGGSGIHSFKVTPQGASFALTDPKQFVWSVLVTDCDFGPDGGFYLSDWVEGWDKTGKGRLYKVFDPGRQKDPVVAEVKRLLAEGFAQRSPAELVKLLEHADMRIRQEAQFALAEKGTASVPVFATVAGKGHPQLARLHAIWGLGQIGRRAPDALKPVAALLKDEDAEVRAQAAKVIGQGRWTSGRESLVAAMKDASTRVRFFAALGLGKVGKSADVPEVLEMLRANADRDAYLRHAGVMALAGIKDAGTLLPAAKDASVSVRLAVLLALRRLKHPEVAQFLKDGDSQIVLEAARAINDEPVPDAMPALASLVTQTGLSEPLLYRVLNANFRLGEKNNAEALAAFAARADVPAALRLEALKELGQWQKPSGRDRLVGVWRALQPRPADVAKEALRPALGGLFSGPDRVRQEAARLAADFGIKEIGPALFDLAFDKTRTPQARVEALKALETLKDNRLSKATDQALADGDPRVRTQGRRLLAKAQPDKAVHQLQDVLERGDVVEKQGAYAILADVPGPAAEEVLSGQLDRLLNGKLSAALHLDLLEAAAKHEGAVKAKLARYEAHRSSTDPLAKYREALAGGDAELGRRIFFEKAEVSCLRCHKVNGVGGEVGPEMKGIGAKQSREYLLESIVAPNRQIAKGYETLVVELRNGQIKSGILKSEDAKEVRLMTAEGQLLSVPKADIADRFSGKSAMPEDLVQRLSRRELRDLVEFLAAQK